MENLDQKDFRSVTILITEKDLEAVRSILNFLKEKYKRFTLTKFTTGKIGENVIVSFKTRSEYYPIVLEKFAFNDIPIIMRDQNSIEYVNEKKEVKRRKLRAEGWSEINKSRKQISPEQLNKLVEEGRLKEVIKEAKGGFGSNSEIKNKAKALISKTVKNAIDNLLFYAEHKPGVKNEVISQLLLIAIDKDLKIFHKIEDMNLAGIMAIEIAASHKSYYHHLIKIANNYKLNNVVNIRSVLKIIEILNDYPQDEIKKLPDFKKELNTKWIKISLDVVKNKFDPKEIENLESFLKMIDKIRSAA